MNLFWKNLFGRITPTAKLEKGETDLINAMNRYAAVKNSDELVEYRRLFQVIKSADFQDNKKMLLNRQYKDTEEFRVNSLFEKLQNSDEIQLYYQVLQSKELKEYLNFKSSDDYKLLGDFNRLKSSEFLQRMRAFEESNDFKTYIRFHDSYIIKEYEQLREKVSAPDFKRATEFWSNERRWYTTPEFALQERFNQLATDPDIQFYERERPQRFDKFNELNIIFHDEFNWNLLEKSPWGIGHYHKNPFLISNYSFANEKQANNSGRNISVEGDTLKISTKYEKATDTAWHTERGFIKKEFDFTSDVIQTANTFCQKYGTIRAKIRCTGNVQHAFWLCAKNKIPHINIFHFNGKNITVGNANNNWFDGVTITGINPSKYYIYTLIWTEKELIWKINNVEVFRTYNNVPKESMYMVFNSFIPENHSGDTGTLEVDWVRAYR